MKPINMKKDFYTTIKPASCWKELIIRDYTIHITIIMLFFSAGKKNILNRWYIMKRPMELQ